MRSDFCYFSDKRDHLVAQCIPRAICLCPICFTSFHLHSLPLTLKLYHTAALFKHHLPSTFIRQPAQFFADAFGLFLVTMHDGILERCAAEATLRRGDSPTANPKISAEAKPSLRSRSLEQCAQASAGVQSLDRLYRTCPP